MGSSTPDESRPDPSAKSDDGDGSDDTSSASDEPEAATDEPPEDGDSTPAANADPDPGSDLIKKLAASIDQGDAAALRGLISGRGGLTVNGDVVQADNIDRALMAKLKAPSEGGPAPRVAFRCDPPARKGTRTCTVFQAQGTWAVELRGTDTGTWLVHALTFTAAN